MKAVDASTLDDVPQQSGRRTKGALTTPQIRVLQVLVTRGGALSRPRISEIIGNKTQVVVGRAIGYSDPDKRAAFEQTKSGGGSPGNPCPSLLTLGYVAEIVLDIDGLKETSVKATPAGIEAFRALGDIKLPPLRDSYNDARDSDEEPAAEEEPSDDGE